MSSFRTSSVFKFTKDFELLKKILRDGIIPNYCEEDLSFDSTEFCVGIPMSCFCDIPITLLDEHNRRYGNYGIALSKEWALKNGLSPVMYIANSDVLQSVYYHIQQHQTDITELVESYLKKNTETTVPDHLRELIKRNSMLRKIEKEHAINTHIIGYLKKYEGVYKSKPINNYEENEWRFLVPDVVGTSWFWSEKDYLKWRFPSGNKNADKPNPSSNMKKYTLRYSSEEVSYLLVKDDEFKSRLIEYIKGLTTIGGKAATEDRRYDLISKIITLEQVRRDF